MRHRTRFLGLLVGALAAATIGLDALPADAGDITTCPPGEDCDQAPLMDAQIAKKAAGPFVGVGDYDDLGTNQIVDKTIKPKKTKTFALRAVNVGDTGDVQLDGTGSSPCFRVRYYLGIWDVTDAAVAGNLAGELAGGTVVPLTLEVKAKGCAAPGQVATTLLDASPTGAGQPHDRVRARVNVV